MSLIRVDCPNCNAANALPHEAIGKVARCCDCHNRFPVKALSTSPVLIATPVPDFAGPPEASVSLKHNSPATATARRDHRTQHHDQNTSSQERKALAKQRLIERQNRRKRRYIVAICVAAVMGVSLALAGLSMFPQLREDLRMTGSNTFQPK